MEYTTKDISKLREITGAGPLDCKNALAEAPNFDAAVKLIEAKGQKRAEKVKAAERETREGGIFAYIHHGNNLGVLLELDCSTDFVARSDEFRNLGKELALQVASMNPKYATMADVPDNVKSTMRKQIEEEPEVQKRPENLRPQIVEGKLKKELASQVLLEQPWVKDEKVQISQLVDNVIRKTGENIVIRRFTRYVLGGE